MIDVKKAASTEDYEALKRIRREVFIEEQDVPEHMEWDEYDRPERTDVTHFLALDDKGAAVGCVRVLNNGKITRMAVVNPYRKQSIGTDLMRAAMSHLSETQDASAYLDAQITALPFYIKQGFVAKGSMFMDAGIEHVRMHFEPAPVAGPPYLFEGAERASRFIQSYTLASTRTLDIFTQALEPSLFQDKSVIESVSHLARRSRQSSIRILVVNPRPLYGKDVPLIRLAQRLPSHIKVKAYLEGAKKEDESYLCFDDAHCIHLSDEEGAVGAAHWENRPLTSTKRDEFEHLWQVGSKEDLNFKRLSL